MQPIEDSVTPPEPPPNSPPLYSSQIPHQVTMRDLFVTFLRVGMTSFGGSTQAWVYRAVVEERAWLDDEAFLAGMTVAQIMPGANPVNLALYVGQQMRGWVGATIAALGMVVPAFCVVLVMAVLYARLVVFPITHFLLLGIATAGVGATLAAGVKVGLRVERKPLRYLVAAIAFATVGLLHWPMVPVVAVLAPVSVALALGRSHG